MLSNLASFCEGQVFDLSIEIVKSQPKNKLLDHHELQ